MAAGELKPPPARLMWGEWPRGAVNAARLAGARRRLRAAPAGDGRPVLVLPGLFNSDRSNFAMRGFLNRLGYRAHPWRLGRNLGARTIGLEGERLFARVEAIVADAGQPVTLIGISLGGIMARLIAHRRPDLVREVITVSSPFAGPPRATNVWRAFEWLTGERIDDAHVAGLRAEVARPLPVPATAIWSASDGLVNGRACRIDAEPAVEVVSSHVGVQLNPDVLVAIAGVLAQRRA
ncbi:esterase/lipase family protein [Sphingomonas sp.]|uniref:esterase/lipase family protein n=1 Tax=Sphingomonas sp. TaxID=28214 RepID=UPI002C2AD28E|nr:alpha/beta fold hydrolase [Sphingomonas sp.]HWK35844.1 alpha/beta fold hydrolase [Sphingomonas sp.]